MAANCPKSPNHDTDSVKKIADNPTAFPSLKGWYREPTHPKPLFWFILAGLAGAAWILLRLEVPFMVELAKQNKVTLFLALKFYAHGYWLPLGLALIGAIALALMDGYRRNLYVYMNAWHCHHCKDSFLP